MPGCTIVTGVSPHSLDVDLIHADNSRGASLNTMIDARHRAGNFGE